MWQARWVLRAIAILISPLVDWTKVVASDRIHGVSARGQSNIRARRSTRVSRVQDDQSFIVEQRSRVEPGFSDR